MVSFIHHLHSGLRFLVLLAGALGVALAIVGLARRKPFSRTGRITSASFVGLLDAQVLAGLVLLAMRPFYGALIGHIVLMVAAAVVAHVFQVLNKRRPEPNWLFLLFGVGGSLALVVLGISAIGRSPFTVTAY